MNISHSQASWLALQDASYKVVDLAERPPPVWVRPTIGLIRLLPAGLMTIGTCETLKKALELMV